MIYLRRPKDKGKTFPINAHMSKSSQVHIASCLKGKSIPFQSVDKVSTTDKSGIGRALLAR